MLELDGSTLEQVVETPRRGDDDVRGARPLRLGVQGDAAVHGRDGDSGRRDRRDLTCNLRGELARRDEHDRCRPLVPRVDPLDDGNREGDGLPRAGRRLREDVAAGERVAQDALLDRERGMDVALGESAHDARGHAKTGKGLLHSRFYSSGCYVVEIRLPRPVGGTEEVKPHRTTDAVRARRVAVMSGAAEPAASDERVH